MNACEVVVWNFRNNCISFVIMRVSFGIRFWIPDVWRCFVVSPWVTSQTADMQNFRSFSVFSEDLNFVCQDCGSSVVDLQRVIDNPGCSVSAPLCLSCTCNRVSNGSHQLLALSAHFSYISTHKYTQAWFHYFRGFYFDLRSFPVNLLYT